MNEVQAVQAVAGKAAIASSSPANTSVAATSSSRDIGMLQFLATTAGAVAWPLAAVAIALIFRLHIRNLFDKLRKLKIGPVEIDIARELDAIEATVPLPAKIATGAELAQNDEQPAAIDNRFQALLAISPNAAILDSWQEVEAAIRAKFAEINYRGSDGRDADVVHMAHHLASHGKMAQEVANIISRLRTLRNRAAHSADVTVADAVRFDELAHRISILLSSEDDST